MTPPLTNDDFAAIRDRARRNGPHSDNSISICVTDNDHLKAIVDRAALVAEVERLRIDSGNYRGKCGDCGTANCDMLTDDYCAACEVARLRVQVSRLTSANAHLQQEVNFLRRRPE